MFYRLESRELSISETATQIGYTRSRVVNYQKKDRLYLTIQPVGIKLLLKMVSK
jgi:hypothetical protein